MANLETGIAQSNEIIKASDFQYAFDAVVDNMGLMVKLMLETQHDFVIGGAVEPYDSESMNINVAPIMGICAKNGAFFGNSEKTVSIPITPANADRIDIVQVKSEWEEFDKQQRAFTDFDTDVQTYQEVYTKKRLKTVVQVKSGIEGSLIAPTTDEGFVKIAEIKVVAGEMIDESNIFNITSDVAGLGNDNWTNEVDRTYNIGLISDVNDRFRKAHEKDGSHKKNSIDISQLSVGVSNVDVNGNNLPIGNEVSIGGINRPATTSIFDLFRLIAEKIDSVYRYYFDFGGEYNFKGELKLSDILNEDKSLYKFFAIGTRTLTDNRRSLYIKFNDTEIMSITEDGTMTLPNSSPKNRYDVVTKSITDVLSQQILEIDAKIRNIETNLDSTVYANNVLSRFKMEELNVLCATTVNITLSNEQVIDNVLASESDIVIVKNQTLANENGIYEVRKTAWVRLSQFDKPTALLHKFYEVQDGKENKGKIYYVPTETYAYDVFGVADIVFSEYYGSIQPIKNTVGYRDAAGRLKTQDPLSDLDSVNRKTLISSLKTWKLSQTIILENDITGISSDTYTYNINIDDISAYEDGMTLKVRFRNPLQSSQAISEVSIAINKLEAKPLKVSRSNEYVLMTSHQMTTQMNGAAGFDSSHPHRVADNGICLEMSYDSEADAWIVDGDKLVMSYTSTNKGYTIRADGLIEQTCITSDLGNFDKTYNLPVAFNSVICNVNGIWIGNGGQHSQSGSSIRYVPVSLSQIRFVNSTYYDDKTAGFMWSCKGY